MNRKEIERKLMCMGFLAGNKGFGYIAEVMEHIHKDGGNIQKITVTYQEIAEKYGVACGTIERCIRHEIRCYYDQGSRHPLLADGVKGRTRLTNREFLARLYWIMCNEEKRG